MKTFVLSTLLSGSRARSLQAVFVLGVLLMAVALLAGNFSPRQPQTVVLDVGLSFLRFSLVLLSVFWIQELVAREIDRRTVIFALTYPVPRHVYLLGRFFGIAILLLVAAVSLALLLGLAVVFAGGGYEQQEPVRLGWPFAATVLALWLDAVVVTAFALWIAALSTVAVLPLALAALFAIAGRSLGSVLQYLQGGAEGDATLTATYLPVLNVVQWILPDLSRLDWRIWPMYGSVPGSLLWPVIMAAAYAALLLVLAVRSFARREFS